MTIVVTAWIFTIIGYIYYLSALLSFMFKDQSVFSVSVNTRFKVGLLALVVILYSKQYL